MGRKREYGARDGTAANAVPRGRNRAIAESVPWTAPSARCPTLELALLRRGVDRLAAGCERCAHCQRTPLIGERIYMYGAGAIAVRALPGASAQTRRGPPESCTAPSSGTRCGSPTSAPRVAGPAIDAGRHRGRAAPIGPASLRIRRVDPFTVSTTIAKPREQVFEYLADIANHAEFTDHYLVDWHLTREDSYGSAPEPGSRSRRR